MSRHAADPRPRPPRHAQRVSRRHPIARAVALTTVATLAFGGTAAAMTYTHMQGNVEIADVSALTGPAPEPSATPDPTDPDAGRQQNILLLGSDDREGVNGVIGGDVAGKRSDTAMVVHIAADRSRIELVSIPRDSLVDIPSCTMTDGSTSREQPDEMFNAAFATGWDQGGDMASAVGCTIKTVQAITGLTIDHFAVVDFGGFVGMVNAIGGVSMCIPRDIESPEAGLSITAGQHTLDGTTALAYARARKGKGLNGSDIPRTGRQQELIAAIVRQSMSAGVLTDVPRLTGLLDAATESLTVDPGLASLTDLGGLAFSLRNTPRSNVVFLTIPVAAAPQDKNRLVWTSAADAVWAAMAADQPIVPAPTPPPVAPTTPTDTGQASPPTDPATVDPSTVAPATPVEPTEPPTPGVDPFTADDVTAVCG